VCVATKSGSKRAVSFTRKTAREAAQEAFRLKKEIEQEETRLRLEQIKLATESAPPTASVSAASHCVVLCHRT
jgi:NAD(P)H-dependent FMN reductase